MKIRNTIYTLLTLCLACWMTVSCVEDNMKTGIVAPRGEAFVSMTIDLGNLPLASTRSGDETGTAEELKIYDVRVVLYDGEAANPGDSKVEYVFDLDIHTPGTWNNTGSVAGWLEGDDLNGAALSGSTLKFTTLPRRVAEKTYKMLVLVNAKDMNHDETIYAATNKGNWLYQVTNEINIQVDPTTGRVKGGKGIFMSNHNKLITITPTQLAKTDDDARANPIQVNVERLVAKVTVNHGSGFSFPAGVDVTSATWGLAVTNKRTYWMRNGMDNESSSTSMANLYARDPNYDHVMDFDQHFNNRLYYDNGSVKISPAAVTNKLGTYEYLLENTVSAENETQNKQLVDQATHVVVGYTYTPQGFSAGESYYIFKGKAISQADMDKYKAAGSYIPDMLSGLREAIDGITDKTAYPLDGSSAMYFETQAIRFCPQGRIYFSFPIRHFEQQQPAFGYYGVVRNNIYDISIKSLTVAESSNRYLSAEINIQPWAMRGQSTTIGVAVGERKWAKVKVYHYLHFNGPNLYREWTSHLNPPMEYHTILAGVGSTVNGTEQHMQQQFRDMDAQYRYLNYVYSVPIHITVSENEDQNVLRLIYSLTYARTSLNYHMPVCFIKPDKTILKVSGINESIPFTSNPAMYLIPFVRKGGGDTEGYVFFDHLYEQFKLTITDGNGNEYIIPEQQQQAYQYPYPQSTTIGGKLTTNDPVLTPPVAMGHVSGTKYGNLGMAIVCQPK